VEDVDIAVKAARTALKDPSWKDLSSSDRGKLLLKLADLVEENSHILATIETWDNGKKPLECSKSAADCLKRKALSTCSCSRRRRQCKMFEILWWLGGQNSR
jgi:acyl-CoA reductase-like NAD-dependent aldehyde dehydrogenase